MKKVLVIGEYHPELLKALDRAKQKNVIEDYCNYSDYMTKPTINTNGLPDAIYTNELDYILSLTNDTFCSDYIVMKGKIHSSDFLRIIIEINKRYTKEKTILSHCAILEKNRTKFILSDAAFNLELTDKNQMAIYNNAVKFYKDFTKKETEPIVNYILAECNENIPNYNKIKGFPETVITTQLDTALDIEKAKFKNGTDAKKADIIIVPDINVGNAIWKSLTTLSDYIASGFIIGTKFVCLLNSRGDSSLSYYKSIVYGTRL